MAEGTKKRKGSGTRLPLRYVVLAFLLTAFAVGLGSLIFFRVSSIEIRGNERYSDETILEAAGLRMGSAMLSVSPGRIESNIVHKLSYADTAQVTLYYPNRVVITVSERYPVAAVFVSGDWWLLDKNCRLLEYGTGEKAADTVVISGLGRINGTIGDIIKVETQDETKLSRLSAVLSAIDDAGLAEEITALSIEDPGNILLTYEKHITVELFSGEGASEKLKLLAEVADMLDVEREGVVSFGTNGEVHYLRK